VPQTTIPIIIVSARCLSNEERGTQFEGVHTAYLDSVLSFGGMPIILPLHAPTEEIEKVCEMADGFLIPGGEDIDPRRYNEDPHPMLGGIAEARDELEFQIVRYARNSRKPLLGICRGSQVMNVACGGTLYQDLAAQRPESPKHKISEWNELSELLTLSAGSKLQAILQCASIAANSLHHQAVKDVAPGLIVSATARDGVIEGIEDPIHPFFVGVQCHPEVLWRETETRWSRVFSRFVEACKPIT
jgi:putative glutamine amidotransferase